MTEYHRLTKEFYRDTDVVSVARNLIGKHLMTNFAGIITGGLIVETEAYAGVTDKASHAYGGRHTNRTRIMYEDGGTAYVYLCYGIHSLFNVVTNTVGVPEAVLIRAIIADTGVDQIAQRLRPGQILSSISPKLTNGPGKVSAALGIHYSHSGLDLSGQEIWIEDRKVKYDDDKSIKTGKRIGVDYAKEDADLPYRFLLLP